jgi:hypothetical protein
LLKIDIAIVARNRFHLISCLGETGGPGEWVWTNTCGHLEVLSIQCVSP